MQCLSGFMITKLFTKNRIIGLICSINLLQSSLFLKFNTFINILTTFLFQFISSYPNTSIKFLFGSWICCYAVLQVQRLFKSNHSIQRNLIEQQFNSIIFQILLNSSQLFSRSAQENWFLHYSVKLYTKSHQFLIF